MSSLSSKLREWYGPPRSETDDTARVDYAHVGFSIDNVLLAAHEVDGGESVGAIRPNQRVHQIIPHEANTTITNQQFFSELEKVAGEKPASESYSEAALWTDRGYVLFDMGWKAESVECFLKALARDQDFAASWVNLGRYFMDPEVRDFDLASDCLKKALELAPNDDVALGNLAGVAFAQERFGDSVAHSQQTVAQNPGNF